MNYATVLIKLNLNTNSALSKKGSDVVHSGKNLFHVVLGLPLLRNGKLSNLASTASRCFGGKRSLRSEYGVAPATSSGSLSESGLAVTLVRDVRSSGGRPTRVFLYRLSL